MDRAWRQASDSTEREGFSDGVWSRAVVTVSGGNGSTRLGAIVGVTALSLAVVLFFMHDAATERIVLLLGFLGPTIAALLKIAQIERNQEVLNGKVDQFRAALEEAVPKVHEAAKVADHAAHTAEEVVPRIEDAAAKLPATEPELPRPPQPIPERRDG